MIQIQFNQADLIRWMSALRRVKRRAHSQIKTQMQMNCAIEYHQLVHKNIMSEKYAPFTAYEDRYAKWKKKKGYKYPGWWKLNLDLVNALTIFKQGDGYVGGIPPGVMDSGGKSYGEGRAYLIAKYGWIAEWGGIFAGQKHPARAVFKPSMDEYAKDDWKKQGQKALNKVGEAWA